MRRKKERSKQGQTNKAKQHTDVYTCTCTCLGKVTALGVLCCFALFVCLTLLKSLLLSFFLLISHLKTCIYMKVHVYSTPEKEKGKKRKGEKKDLIGHMYVCLCTCTFTVFNIILKSGTCT